MTVSAAHMANEAPATKPENRVKAAPSQKAEGLIILYGALRSGSTLLRLMLDAHPQVSCPGERDFLVDFYDEREDGALVLDADGLARHRIFQKSGLTIPKAPSAEDAAFWQMVAEDRARQQALVYVPVFHRGLDTLLRLHPGAKIIHLLRDPRDVARSSIGMGWAGNTWYGVNHWLRTERGWDAVQSQLNQTQNPVFTLRYEDLLEAPEDTLTQLCQFVGLDYAPQMLDFSQSSTYEPVNPKLAYQWRRKQSPRDVAELESKIGALLTARGYTPGDRAAAAPGPLRRTQLWAQNKVKIWRHRIDHFGLGDPVVLALCRHGLLPARFGLAAKGRKQTTIQQHLK